MFNFGFIRLLSFVVSAERRLFQLTEPNPLVLLQFVATDDNWRLLLVTPGFQTHNRLVAGSNPAQILLGPPY